MAGGSGTRFWPKSRRSRPKQLLRLFGDATMLQQTVERISPLVPPERVLVVTGEDQAEASRRQVPQVPAANVVSEPCPRDTAACVGLAAALIARTDPDATLVVLAADHVVDPPETFRKTIAVATSLVEDDPTRFVTMGIRPTRPETGYGYIEAGELLETREGIGVRRVIQFREKPDRPTAEEFLAQGRFAWNSGVFVWKARAILDALHVHRPGLAAAVERVAAACGTPEAEEVLRREYPRMERIPIDKAVMEKAGNVVVLDVGYSWSDVGDWRSLSELKPADPHHNVTEGPVRLIDTHDSVVLADDGRLIAAIGIHDLVVIQSGGATLIARRDQLDRLKMLVEGLGQDGFGEYT
jgi:mannose-1-phosphate guanylyltransferase